MGEATSCSVVVQTNKSGMVWGSKELKKDLISVNRKNDLVMRIELR